MFKITYLALLFVLFTSIKSDCLTKSELEELGFKKIKEAPEKVEDGTTCSDLFKEYGACVDVDEVRDVLEDDQEELVETMSIKSKVIDLLEDIEDSIKDEADNVAKVAQIRENLENS